MELLDQERLKSKDKKLKLVWYVSMNTLRKNVADSISYIYELFCLEKTYTLAEIWRILS